MSIPPSQDGLDIDWANFNPSMSEIIEAARNVDLDELPAADEVIRALMHVPPGQSNVAMQDWVFPNLTGYQQLQDQLTDPHEIEQRTPRTWSSSHGERTPAAVTTNIEMEAEASTISPTTESSYPGPSQQHLDALSDYEATLSCLYDATTGTTNTNNESGTGQNRHTGPYSNAASQRRTGTTVNDASTRWLLVYSLMASFKSLHPSQVVQSTNNRPIFQDVVWELWLVVQRGEREAVRRLDQALRGNASQDF